MCFQQLGVKNTLSCESRDKPDHTIGEVTHVKKSLIVLSCLLAWLIGVALADSIDNYETGSAGTNDHTCSVTAGGGTPPGSSTINIPSTARVEVIDPATGKPYDPPKEVRISPTKGNDSHTYTKRWETGIRFPTTPRFAFRR